MSRTIEPHYLREFIVKCEEPFILKGYLKNFDDESKIWCAFKWSPEDWSKLLEKEKVKVRFGKRVGSEETLPEPQWESTCYKGLLEYNELLQWDDGGSFFELKSKTLLRSSNFWAYFDYFYMKDVNNIELVDRILSWETLGYPEIKGKDTSLWIGSAGANTPCHQDTYGVNVIIQLVGTKKWTLFPPEDSGFLYSTRIPYEESSIYSSIGFPNVDYNLHPKLLSTRPRIVTLKPGDVLVVPHKWWHFVESLEFSINVNTWISCSSDSDESLKEALTAFQVGMFCQSISSSRILSFLNPNMIEIATLSSSEILRQLVERYCHIRKESCARINETSNICHRFSEEGKLLWEESVKNQVVTLLRRSSYNRETPESKPLDCSPHGEFDFIKVLFSSLIDDRVIDVLKYVIEQKITSQ